MYCFRLKVVMILGANDNINTWYSLETLAFFKLKRFDLKLYSVCAVCRGFLAWTEFFSCLGVWVFFLLFPVVLVGYSFRGIFRKSRPPIKSPVTVMHGAVKVSIFQVRLTLSRSFNPLVTSIDSTFFWLLSRTKGHCIQTTKIRPANCYYTLIKLPKFILCNFSGLAETALALYI